MSEQTESQKLDYLKTKGWHLIAVDAVSWEVDQRQTIKVMPTSPKFEQKKYSISSAYTEQKKVDEIFIDNG